MERRQKKMDIKLDRIEEKVDSMYNRTDIIEKVDKFIKSI